MKGRHTDPYQLIGPGCLSIRVCRADGLPDTEENEFFCKISCDFSRQTFASHTKKTTSPSWEEDFHFYVGIPLPTHTVNIQIFTRDGVFHSEMIGQANFTLKGLLDVHGDTTKEWYPIIPEPTKSNPKNGKKDCGQLYVKVYFPKDADLRGAIKQEDPKKFYNVERIIGEGSFGTVKLCNHKITKQPYAMKIINKTKMNKSQLELLQREIIIMSKLSHPHIVHLEEAFDTDKTTCLVLELITGGSILTRLLTVGPYPEPDACVIMKQLLEACQYMSSCGIAHRDLKPDNILITDEGEIKISDFGLSKDFTTSILVSAVGTANYVAPEVLSGAEYNSACDVWSCGVICYAILSTQMPFFGKDNARVFEKILAVDYSFPDDYFGQVSDTALDFIDSIFVLNPLKRASYQDLLHHAWILMYNNSFEPQPKIPKLPIPALDDTEGAEMSKAKTKTRTSSKGMKESPKTRSDERPRARKESRSKPSSESTPDRARSPSKSRPKTPDLALSDSTGERARSRSKSRPKPDLAESPTERPRSGSKSKHSRHTDGLVSSDSPPYDRSRSPSKSRPKPDLVDSSGPSDRAKSPTRLKIHSSMDLLTDSTERPPKSPRKLKISDPVKNDPLCRSEELANSDTEDSKGRTRYRGGMTTSSPSPERRPRKISGPKTRESNTLPEYKDKKRSSRSKDGGPTETSPERKATSLPTVGITTKNDRKKSQPKIVFSILDQSTKKKMTQLKDSPGGPAQDSPSPKGDHNTHHNPTR